MFKGDYKEITEIGANGKKITRKVVKSTTGVEYIIGPRLGQGGVAKVFRAKRRKDNKVCVFKEYVPSPENRVVHRKIKNNIKQLMIKPLMEEDGKTPLKSFIGPMDKDSLIELSASGGFGYIMEMVDTKVFMPIPKLWHSSTHPDDKALCKACWNLAYLFRRIHLGNGWCYKDINEGNIYIDSRTGNVRIIDCDNISKPSVKCIIGTDGYMAPEVYITHMPDTYTDYFSLAVLFYRLMVGGYPLDGKKTTEYLLNNELSIQEAASTIYGSMALFAFDPNNRANTIRGLIDKQKPEMYKCQCIFWDNLPEEIRQRFIQTFSTGLLNDNRARRTSDKEWMNTFEILESKGLLKCKCGKYVFGNKNKTRTCPYCGKKLPKLPNSSSNPTITQPNTKTLSTVVFHAKMDVAPFSLEIIAQRNVKIPSKKIYSKLPFDGWMKIQYSKSKNLLSAVNNSGLTWIVKKDGISSDCPPSSRVVLEVGMTIIIFKRQFQMKVAEIK